MLTFYYNAAPNPMKVALLLEELGLPFDATPVDTRKGEQFGADFLAVNPNAKLPALKDGETTVFDSNAILMYLADREQRFIPAVSDGKARGEMLSWLLFIATGIGPFSGQSVHFRHAAPEPKEYALNRYDYEAHRHWALIEQRLKANRFMLGETYSIVDMALWGWARMLPYVLDGARRRRALVQGAGDRAAHAPRHCARDARPADRPAAQRAEALKARHAFKAEMDDEAKRFMFPQNERLKA